MSEIDYAGLSVSLSLIKKITSIHLCASLDQFSVRKFVFFSKFFTFVATALH